MESKNYTQHVGKVVESNYQFTHVMAISLDSSYDYKRGLVRCITSREGDVSVRGYVDRSELHFLLGDSLEHFEIGQRVKIKNEEEVIKKLSGRDLDFIGLEDPDIFIDEKTGLTHLYCTMPFLVSSTKGTSNKKVLIYLGHAVGKNIDSLEMTDPVLMVDKTTKAGAKELSIAPISLKGFRYNLVESSINETDFIYSTVRVAIAKDMNKNWEYGEIVFHPKEHNIPWIAGHASPGPLLPKSFMDLGAGKMLGIMNGREANQKIGDKIKYGMFSVGLFIYDYENGKIDWVSPKPLIQDSEAKTITFASQFVETAKRRGILYAHVDDSFVRAYTIEAEKLKNLLPK